MILNINEYSNEDFYLKISKLLPNIKEGYFCESVEIERDDSLTSIISSIFPEILKNNLCNSALNSTMAKKRVDFTGSLNTNSEKMILIFSIVNTCFFFEFNGNKKYLTIKNFKNKDLEFILDNDNINFKIDNKYYEQKICNNIYKLIALCFYGDIFFDHPERIFIENSHDINFLLDNLDLYFNYILLDEIIAY